MAYKAVVITVSDRCSRGEATDTSGPAIVEMVTAEGYEVIHTEIVPDEKERIREVLIRCADEMKAELLNKINVWRKNKIKINKTDEAIEAV